MGRRNSKGERNEKHTETHTHVHTSGDFISLPVISQLNNSGQGITSAGLDGSEQQSHTGGK